MHNDSQSKGGKAWYNITKLSKRNVTLHNQGGKKRSKPFKLRTQHCPSKRNNPQVRIVPGLQDLVLRLLTHHLKAPMISVKSVQTDSGQREFGKFRNRIWIRILILQIQGQFSDATWIDGFTGQTYSADFGGSHIWMDFPMKSSRPYPVHRPHSRPGFLC